MKTRVDDRLRREAARFSFRFACDDCVHASRKGARPLGCSLGYPLAPRREDLSRAEIELCKTFEL